MCPGRNDAAMPAGSLPEEGEFQLGSIRLPAGKRVSAGWFAPVPVAWVTREGRYQGRADVNSLRPSHLLLGQVPVGLQQGLHLPGLLRRIHDAGRPIMPHE
jgi:hypothetical protein